MTTITLTGEENTLLARALKRLLANRGFAIVETDHGEGFEALTLDLTEEDAENLLALGTEPEKAPVLDLSVPDIFGNTPDVKLYGRRYRHTGNGKDYEVRGFVWMGEDDVWGFLHQEAYSVFPVMLVRPLSHLTGNRAHGTPRYERVP